MEAIEKKSIYNHWLFTYKIYHIPFWAIYHYLWWSLSSGSPLDAANFIFFSPFSAKYSFYVLFQAIGAYFNLYFLIPKFLEKGQFLIYISALLITIVLTSILIVPGYYVAAWLAAKPLSELYRVEDAHFFHFVYTNSLPSTVGSTTLAMSIKLTKNWLQSQRRQQLLEKEKLETELKFLRSQFNPHFLFNTINSIFFLIHKNPSQASSSLAQFSELLRYQLYECNEQQIPLRNEISYLKNFIDLEKLRLNERVKVYLEIEETLNRPLEIAPFILMPFVENSFKHVSNYTQQANWIRLRLQIKEQNLFFNASNSISYIKTKEAIAHEGIGLKNVKRRLDLIYPEKYQLNIYEDHASFEVELQVELQETQIPQSEYLNELET